MTKAKNKAADTDTKTNLEKRIKSIIITIKNQRCQDTNFLHIFTNRIAKYYHFEQSHLSDRNEIYLGKVNIGAYKYTYKKEAKILLKTVENKIIEKPKIVEKVLLTFNQNINNLSKDHLRNIAEYINEWKTLEET